ncbi:MAG: hypothetical protein U0746_15045 [Gemmataceae bacterium]
MGLGYDFYVQKRTGPGWAVPADFVTARGERSELGYFTWIDDKDSVREAFWGANPLFPMRRDRPPGVEEMAVFQEAGPDAFADWYHSWLPMEELALDLWDQFDVLVCKRVAARYALHFGDGGQSFPRSHLLSAGLAAAAIDKLEATSYYVSDAALVGEPVDWNHGKRRHELAGVGPDWGVGVTWRVSIAGFLGGWRTAEFRNLRRFGRDDELRIVCLFS